MTYDQLIEVTRNRGKSWLLNTTQWEKGTVYDAINSAIREIGALGKPSQTTASLSIISGTTAYTISTAIAADVDEIHFIRVGNAEIKPISYADFENLTIDGEADETDTDTTDETQPDLYFKVVGGTLTLSFTPSQNLTATVYYSQKVVQAFYSVANGALTVPYSDLFLSAIIYEALAVLSENLALFQQAANYRMTSKMKLDEAKQSEPYYEFGQQIAYCDPINGST